MTASADGKLTLTPPLSPQLDFDRSPVNISLDKSHRYVSTMYIETTAVKGQNLVHTPDI